MNTATHTAWRFNNKGDVLYVEHAGNNQHGGDRYSYTTKEANAKKMTETQCRAFCKYMQECATVGFWS